jgi:N-methylhydantoinase B/oxoprolinase/acetone carboxylase alpha subunit
LVTDFLKENPHFVQAAPAGSGARPSAQGKSKAEIDVSKLDMKNPEHRKVYAEYRKTAGLA